MTLPLTYWLVSWFVSISVWLIDYLIWWWLIRWLNNLFTTWMKDEKVFITRNPITAFPKSYRANSLPERTMCTETSNPLYCYFTAKLAYDMSFEAGPRRDIKKTVVICQCAPKYTNGGTVFFSSSLGDKRFNSRPEDLSNTSVWRKEQDSFIRRWQNLHHENTRRNFKWRLLYFLWFRLEFVV